MVKSEFPVGAEIVASGLTRRLAMVEAKYGTALDAVRHQPKLRCEDDLK
jgi:hypothetical protein